MNRQRLPVPRFRRVSPGQMTLDAALLAYPEAERFARTRTGTTLAVLPGGARRTPAAAQTRRAA